jgi:hypothetical protein
MVVSGVSPAIAPEEDAPFHHSLPTRSNKKLSILQKLCKNFKLLKLCKARWRIHVSALLGMFLRIAW